MLRGCAGFAGMVELVLLGWWSCISSGSQRCCFVSKAFEVSRCLPPLIRSYVSQFSLGLCTQGPGLNIVS